MQVDFEEISKLQDFVSKAESRVNHIGDLVKRGVLSSGLDIPAINELRYSLNHFLRYFHGDNDGVNGAIKHAKRAIYDCYETEALYLFDRFIAFEEENSDIVISKVFPNYIKWAIEFRNLREFIANTPKENRDKYYESLEKRLDDIKDFSIEAKAVRQEILKLKEEREEQKNKYNKDVENAELNRRIAEENLKLAQKTVKIRTRVLIITVIGCLTAVATYFFKP